MRLKWDYCKLAIFMVAYYATNGLYQSFISLYYESIHFDSAQIGLISAAIALASLATQPVWGMLGDRAKDRRRLLAGMALAAGALILCCQFTSRYALVLLISIAFAGFYMSLQPMGDAIILKKLDARGEPFGPIRMCGGGAYAVAGVVFGQLLNRPGQERWVPAYTAALCALVAASTLALPKDTGGQSASGNRMSFAMLLKDRPLMRLLLFMMPIQITMGYFYTFFSPHFVSLEGGSKALLGVCYFIAACSEFVFLIFSDRLFDRFGAGKLMCVSAVSLALRWLILGTTRSVPVAMASQLLHGWGFIVMTVCMAKYISRNVPVELQSSGQMLLAIFTFGIARVVGNLGGGLLASAMGRQSVFYVCAGVNIAALLLLGPHYLRPGRTE